MRKISYPIGALVLVIILGLADGCNKEKWFAGPNFMSEDFESYTHVDSLFKSDESRWSFNQNTVDGNYIALDTTIVHTGNQSLKFFAYASPPNRASKCSIVKQHMAFSKQMWYVYRRGTTLRELLRPIGFFFSTLKNRLQLVPDREYVSQLAKQTA